MTDRPNGLTYAQAGVDIDAGNALIERIKPFAKATRRPGADAALGGSAELHRERVAAAVLDTVEPMPIEVAAGGR